jgi:hypothetical protein
MARTNLPVPHAPSTALVPLPPAPRQPTVSVALGLTCGVALALVLGLLLALLVTNRSGGAGGVAAATLHVPPLIVAEPWTPSLLPIHHGPLERMPQRGSIRITGLPLLASLSQGHALAKGSWSVPVDRLLGLTISAPTGEGVRFHVNIALMSPSGSVLAEAQSMLVVVSATRLFPTAGHSPAIAQPSLDTSCPEAAVGVYVNAGPEPSPGSAERRIRGQAEMLVVAGNRKMADGNLAAAREFYRRAAEMGWSPAAFALGATYDPREVLQAQVPGVSADVQMARCWYARARELVGLEAASLKN